MDSVTRHCTCASSWLETPLRHMKRQGRSTKDSSALKSSGLKSWRFTVSMKLLLTLWWILWSLATFAIRYSDCVIIPPSTPSRMISRLSGRNVGNAMWETSGRGGIDQSALVIWLSVLASQRSVSSCLYIASQSSGPQARIRRMNLKTRIESMNCTVIILKNKISHKISKWLRSIKIS